mmetsp:Transcript_43530/g.92640  ORF Transcript_43530/g.92640 Transcript_43530/m.92640 type:complete len:92 (+) Transcript_43530:1582-1857(+)
MVTVYIVGGPDVKAGEGRSGCTSSFELLYVSPIPPLQAMAQTPRKVSTRRAGRHFVASVPNGSTLRLKFELSFCLYVIYVTNEPYAEAGSP